MTSIEIVQGDITKIEADAVVNAANRRMRGGGGVDGAIHRVGGPSILDDCVNKFPDGLGVGRAGFTTAGELSAKHVVHTVGPNYRAGQRDRALLESCYRDSLTVADQLSVKHVAFPLISAGTYGWPTDDAIAVAIDTVAGAVSDVERVTFVAYNAALADAMRTYYRLATPLRLLAGIRELHRRGYRELRFLPYIYSLGTWRLPIGASRVINDQGAHPQDNGDDRAIRYTSAAGAEFCGGRVTGATPVGTVADLIINALPDLKQGSPSPRYLAWIDDVLDRCAAENAVPLAFDDDYQTDGATWKLTSGTDVPAPPSIDGGDTLTMGDLFVRAPAQWGYRGDRRVWIAVARRLSGVPIPSEFYDVRGLIDDAFAGETGHSVSDVVPDGFVEYKRHEVDRGAEAMVNLAWWNDTASRFCRTELPLQ